jgi:hypothetical protein
MTSGRSRRRINAHPLFGFSDTLKLDDSVCQGKQRVIAADPNIGARVHLCTALSDDDTPRKHLLTSEALNAEPLGIAVASVS